MKNFMNLTKVRLVPLLFIFAVLIACNDDSVDIQSPAADENYRMEQQAEEEQQRIIDSFDAEAADFIKNNLSSENGRLGSANKTILEIAASNQVFSSLAAAVIKTGLTDALANPKASLTVFAPGNSAFAKLPAPFNNAANISAISDPGQIDFLRKVLLYHVLGAEVFYKNVANGRSSAQTLKPQGVSNDNTLYFSKRIFLKINGQTSVIVPDIDAKNGVIHVVNNVLLFPTQNIAEIALGNPAFSSLVAALVKTNLVGVFTGSGDFTVFAPTNEAFGKLPAPFNSASNIAAITNQAEIDALANILKYHVAARRYFGWDLGFWLKIETLASAPNNKVTTFVGYPVGYVKGNNNKKFAAINPGDILATNGVVHVIGEVLLP